MKPLTIIALTILPLCLLNVSCSKNGGEQAQNSEDHKPPPTTDKLEPYECGTVQKLHTLGGIFLGSQPNAADFEQAKKGGIKTVINMRHSEEITDFDEAKVVTDLGLEYVHVPWNGPEELTDEIFDRTRELLKSSTKPVLLHCSSANRVGAVWIPYRVLEDGISIEEALAEAKTVGLKSPDYEQKAKDYIQRKSGS